MRRKDLLDVLKVTATVSGKKDVNDAFSCLFLLDDKVRATNGMTAIIAKLPEPTGINAAVPSQALISALTSIVANEVVLRQNDRTVSVVVPNGTTRLASHQVDVSAAVMTLNEPEEWKPLPPGVVAAIKTCAPAVSTNEVRVNALSGILVGSGMAWATDRVRVTVALFEGECEQMLVPGFVAKELGNLSGDLEYATSGSRLFVRSDKYTLVAPLINDQFPNLMKFLPDTSTQQPVTLSDEVVAAMKKHLVLQKMKDAKDRRMRIEFVDGEVCIIESQASGYADIKETVSQPCPAELVGKHISVNPMFFKQAVDISRVFYVCSDKNILLFVSPTAMHILMMR